MFFVAIVEIFWPSLNFFVYYFHADWLKILQTIVYWIISPYVLKALGCKPWIYRISAAFKNFRKKAG